MHESLITILQPFLKILNPKKKAPYQVYGVFSVLGNSAGCTWNVSVE